MNKKYFSIILCALLLLCACTTSAQPPRESLPTETPHVDTTGYVVENPMKYPDYTFDHEPTVQELRETAVRAMKDLLSIQWSTAKKIAYNKSGPISEKRFQHQADTTYAGTPYSNGSTGIFQFFEYYDQETGRFWYPGTAGELSRNLGNSCADSLIWAYDTVCTTINGGYYPATMVYANGYYPVGDYVYNFEITTYNKLPTGEIIKQNGRQVIMDSYSKILMGDALVSTSDNHGMMAIEDAHVVMQEDGNIDTAASYIMIQDQRGGSGEGFYEKTENGKLIQYSGRTSAKYTFDELYKKTYLPVRPAEFMGAKEYEKAAVSATKDKCNSLDELMEGTVSSNYPMAVINVIVCDDYGNETVMERVIFGGNRREGPPREYNLENLDSLKEYSSGKFASSGSCIKIEVVVSTGERFIPVTANY